MGASIMINLILFVIAGIEVFLHCIGEILLITLKKRPTTLELFLVNVQFIAWILLASFLSR